jgi:hypothetical protein
MKRLSARPRGRLTIVDRGCKKIAINGLVQPFFLPDMLAGCPQTDFPSLLPAKV